jgi:serine carboxypeptidase
VPYSAIVEEHILTGPDSIPNASLVTIAYVRDSVPATERRPVMFVFNGGPGASSSPLHMNGLGPRRTGGSGTVENPNSILDATDLVFIDPIGTGFSRPYTADVGKGAQGALSTPMRRALVAAAVLTVTVLLNPHRESRRLGGNSMSGGWLATRVIFDRAPWRRHQTRRTHHRTRGRNVWAFE